MSILVYDNHETRRREVWRGGRLISNMPCAAVHAWAPGSVSGDPSAMVVLDARTQRGENYLALNQKETEFTS